MSYRIAILLFFFLIAFDNAVCATPELKIQVVVFGKVNSGYLNDLFGFDVNDSKKFKKKLGSNVIIEFNHLPSNRVEQVSVEDEFSFLPLFAQSTSCVFSFCNAFSDFDNQSVGNALNSKKVVVGSSIEHCSLSDSYEHKDLADLKILLDKCVKKKQPLVIYDISTFEKKEESKIGLVIQELEDRVKLNCEVEKEKLEDFTFEWYVNGDLMKGKKSSSIFISSDDQRNYQCVVKNKITGCESETEEYTHAVSRKNQKVKFDLPKDLAQKDIQFSDYFQFGPTPKDQFVIITNRVPGCDEIVIKVFDDLSNEQIFSTKKNYADFIEVSEFYGDDSNIDDESDESTKEKNKYLKMYPFDLVLFLEAADLGSKWEEGNEIPRLKLELVFKGAEFEEDIKVSRKVILHRCPLFIE
jgi:hypothetical protein